MSIGSRLHSNQFPLQIFDLDVQSSLFHAGQDLGS